MIMVASVVWGDCGAAQHCRVGEQAREACERMAPCGRWGGRVDISLES